MNLAAKVRCRASLEAEGRSWWQAGCNGRGLWGEGRGLWLRGAKRSSSLRLAAMMLPKTSSPSKRRCALRERERERTHHAACSQKRSKSTETVRERTEQSKNGQQQKQKEMDTLKWTEWVRPCRALIHEDSYSGHSSRKRVTEWDSFRPL